VGADGVGEVGVQAAALEAAGGVRGEQPFDAAFAVVGLGAEAEFAVDDGASQRAFGVVVGRFDRAVVGERPQCRPDLEQVAGQAARVLIAGCLA
jgi:hypothetical protein